MKFILRRRFTTGWNGSDETAGEFGYGDYRKEHLEEVSQLEAKDRKEAIQISRKLFKEKGLKSCLFSGVGYNAFLEEV